MNSPSKRGEMNLLDYTQYEWDIIGIGSLTDSMELNLILHWNVLNGRKTKSLWQLYILENKNSCPSNLEHV